MKTPDPSDIRTAREAAGLSQTAAAAVIYKARNTWAQWEAGERAMDPAFWELFRIKTGQLQAPMVRVGHTAASRPA